MIAELGFLLLIVSSLLAGLLAFLPFISRWLCLSPRSLSFTISTTITASFIIFVTLFLQNDFSVQAVAHHSNSFLPLPYKISASWGSHQGSMFLWILFLSFWLVGFAIFSAKNIVSRHTLSFLSCIIFLLLNYLLFFSDPFARLFPAPLQGGDLNPMLQDIGLILHPPLLYLGYSGLALAFSFTLAALFHQQIHQDFALSLQKITRPAWGFLTLGILVGCSWAYYELGWGGWWFWDPSENASLMPWLLATGLLHSLTLNRHNIGFYWTIILALLSFLFTLLGTFIIRSGILTSVHSFNNGVSQSTALLSLWAILTFLALGILLWKGGNFHQQNTLNSANWCILLVIILLCVGCFIVWLGSFYPLFYQALNFGRISVGSPYFNTLILPIIFLLLVILAIFLVVTKNKSILFLAINFFFALFLTTCLIVNYAEDYHAKLTPFLWLTITLFVILLSLKNHHNKAMMFSHLGLLLAICAAVMSSYFIQEKNLALNLGDNLELPFINGQFENLDYQLHSNYTTEVAYFSLQRKDQKLNLSAEKRYYDWRPIMMSEVGIHHFIDGDLYLVIGDKLNLNHYRFQIAFKPFISLLWFGGLLMSIGAFVGLFSSVKKKVIK